MLLASRLRAKLLLLLCFSCSHIPRRGQPPSAVRATGIWTLHEGFPAVMRNTESEFIFIRPRTIALCSVESLRSGLFLEARAA